MAATVISVGVVTPHAAPGPEAEFPHMSSGQVVTHVSRIPALGATGATPGIPPGSPPGLLALCTPSALDRAVAALVPGSVDVIAHASTTTGYALGFDAETEMLERLSQRCGLPVAGTSVAVVAALRAFDVERVALVHPPWFEDELHALGAAYFGGQGFDVVASGPADVPDDPSRIEPGAVIEWVSLHVSDDAEAVFIGGNGFRAAPAIEQLEQRLERPVFESNQVLLWSILATLDADLEVHGYGTLFGR